MEILYCYDLEHGMIQDENDNEKQDLIPVDTPFYDFIIISSDNKILMMWHGFVKLVCLISSYFYLYMASYLLAGPSHFDLFFNIDITFEAIFLVAMLLEFITDFKTGSQQKVNRDLLSISKKYIKGNLLYDFIAIIPFSLLIKINGGYERLFYLLKMVRF